MIDKKTHKIHIENIDKQTETAGQTDSDRWKNTQTDRQTDRQTQADRQTCCGPMLLSLGLLLEGVGHRNGLVAQMLSVHGINGCIRGIEAGVLDERKSFGIA